MGLPYIPTLTPQTTTPGRFSAVRHGSPESMGQVPSDAPRRAARRAGKRIRMQSSVWQLRPPVVKSAVRPPIFFVSTAVVSCTKVNRTLESLENP